MTVTDDAPRQSLVDRMSCTAAFAGGSRVSRSSLNVNADDVAASMTEVWQELTPLIAGSRLLRKGGVVAVSCVSGNSVEGVWVQAGKGSGWAPWRGLGNGSTSDWWFTLPVSEPYALHVGCGGTTANWAVATYTPNVTGPHNSFNCFDVQGQSGFGTCRLR